MVDRVSGSRAIVDAAVSGCTPGGDQIANAAVWLADNWHVAPQPITKTLREMFGLKFNDAVRAMVRAKALVEMASVRQ
jgi:hypothetical protein